MSLTLTQPLPVSVMVGWLTVWLLGEVMLKGICGGNWLSAKDARLPM